MKKRILCAMLAFILVLSCGSAAFADDFSCADETQAVSSVGTYSFYVTYHQTEARQITGMINAMRTSGNAWYWNEGNATKTYCGVLGELEYDYELETAAMQRAAELVVMYAHSRPNGEEKPYNLYYHTTSAGENIAYGYTSAQSVHDAWAEEDEYYAKQGHRRNMLSRNHTAVGIACAEYNGVKYWVQEFRTPPSNMAATAANNSSTLVSVDILDEYISTKSALTASKTSYSLNAGDSAALPSVTQTIKIAKSPGNTINTIKKCTFTSSDTAVAKVQGGRIVAVGEGSATLTGKGTGSESVRITVTVSQGDAPPDVSQDDPVVSIRNYTAKRTEKTGTLLYLSAVTQNAPADAHIEWNVKYSDGTQKTIVKGLNEQAEIQVSSDLSVTAKLVDSSDVLAQSKTETVETAKGIFAALMYIIRLIFGITPKVIQ